MNKSELTPSLHVAYRERRSVDAPLHEVEVLDGVARDRQVKVLFVDGEREGLRSWVRTAQLLCAWNKREAVLKDERRAAALRQDWGAKYDPVVDTAMNAVVVATGESGGFANGWSEQPAVFARLWKRAGLEPGPVRHHLAYRDRHGQAHLPWDTVVEFCLAFSRHEPSLVLSLIDGYDREYEARGHLPGEVFYHQLLRENAAAHALVREWCGQAEERTRLLAEIKRLQGLLSTAEADLRRAGDERGAGRLARAVRGQ
jgi:hypothetical protein